MWRRAYSGTSRVAQPERLRIRIRWVPMDTLAPNARLHPRRTRGWHIAGYVLLGLLVLLIAAYVIQYVTRGRFWRSTFLHYATKTAGREVRIGGDFQLYLHPNIRFVAEKMTVANPAWAKDKVLFDAGRIETDVSIWKLITGEQHVNFLAMSDAAIGLEQRKDGSNTWTFAGDKPFKLPPIDTTSITGTRLHYIDEARRADVRLAFGDVAARGRQVAAPLTFTGGGTAVGAPFTLHGTLETPNAAIAGGRTTVVAHAAAADTTVDVTGTLVSPTRIDGLDLHFAAAGRNLQTPSKLAGVDMPATPPFTLRGTITTPDSRIAGGRTKVALHATVADTIFDVSGALVDPKTIEGADLRVAVSGHNLQAPFRLLGIAVPSTRPFRLASNLTKDGGDYRFTRLAGRIGDSDIGGKLTVTRPAQRLRLEGDLHTRVLSIVDVGPLVGYSPDKLQASGGKAVITTENGHPRVLPDAPLAVEGLKPYDAAIRYTADKVSTGTADIRHLQLDLGLDHSLLTLRPLAFDLAGGRLTSNIAINARTAPVATDYDIRLSQVPLNKLLAQFKVDDSGTTATLRGRVQLKGYGDTVRKSLGTSSGRIAVVFPKGTLWIRNIELVKLDAQNFLTAFLGKKLKKPREINCGLVAFTVKDGVAEADPVFFDTNKANLIGKGHFSFADESLALSIRGDSKEFSVFSGQSPIGINGWFAAPKVNPISKQLIARAGAGVGLGLLFPPAAALAFIDVGDAKNSNCAPIVGAKTAAAVARAQPEKLQKSLRK